MAAPRPHDDQLHHGTSITGFCQIALTDLLGAYGGENQASFTLDRAMAEHFARAAVTMCAQGQLAQYADLHRSGDSWDGTAHAAHRGETAAGGTGVVITFDRASLHAAHAFSAVNFASPDLPTVDLDYSGREREECAFEDVTDLSGHVVGLSIDAETFDLYRRAVEPLLLDDPQGRAALEAGTAWVDRFRVATTLHEAA